MPLKPAITGNVFLELDGQSVPVNSVEGGAAVGVVVTAAPTAGAGSRGKRLSGVRYEPIAIAASSRRARPLFDWITTAWQGTRTQKTGAVIRVDASKKPQAKRAFEKATLVETTVPTLDGASKDVADFTVRLAPERTRDVKPQATLPPAGQSSAKDILQSANFRLEIGGLDCTRVSKIDSFTVKQNLATGAPEFPDLRIELAAVSADTWRTWFESFVIDGRSSATDEKSGSLSFLTANVATVLATINFHNLGIFRLENAPGAPGHVVAELYCQRMELVIPPD